jgi:hypothetical protein
MKLGNEVQSQDLELSGDMLAVSIMMKTIKIKTLLEVLLRDASG